MRVFARQGFHTCRVSDIADEAGVAYGLVYHYFQLQGRGARHAVPRALGRHARGDPRDRRAATSPPRDKLEAIASLHRRLLPPRPGPDEGDHRRGHARGELVRRARTWPRSARPTADRGDRRAGRRPTASSATDVTPQFAAMAFYGAIEQVLTGWIFGLLAAGARTTTSRPRSSSSRRSAAASRRTRRDRLLDSGAMTDNDIVKRLHVVRPARRHSAPLATIATTRLARLIWRPRVRGRSARVSEQDEQRTPAERGRGGRARPTRRCAEAHARRGHGARRGGPARGRGDRRAPGRGGARRGRTSGRGSRESRSSRARSARRAKAEKEAAEALEARTKAEQAERQAHAAQRAAAAAADPTRPRRRRRPASAPTAAARPGRRAAPEPPPPRRRPSPPPSGPRCSSGPRSPAPSCSPGSDQRSSTERCLISRSQSSARRSRRSPRRHAAARARGDRARQGRDDGEGPEADQAASSSARSPASSPLFGLIYLLHAASWGIWELLGTGNGPWLGFLIVTLMLFLLGAIGGLLAFRFIKKATPPDAGAWPSRRPS